MPLSWKTLLPSLVWILFLLGLFGFFYQQWLRLHRMRKWHTVKGKITYFHLQQEGLRLWPEIEYHYRIGQEDYYNHYLFADTIHNSPHSAYARELAYRVARAYQNDEPVTVYYNPLSPEQAVLDIRMPRKLGVILLLLGVFIILEAGLLLSKFPLF
ncbi:MAG: DUF3592 domain-containing protein [Legionellaceae bacterium]|nr:DUF3592 domain-containing protein [Legionellaceae bacterium]